MDEIAVVEVLIRPRESKHAGLSFHSGFCNIAWLSQNRPWTDRGREHNNRYRPEWQKQTRNPRGLHCDRHLTT